jgi:hypothetical protein
MARIHEFAGHRLAHVADTEIPHLHRASPQIDFRRLEAATYPRRMNCRALPENLSQSYNDRNESID